MADENKIIVDVVDWVRPVTTANNINNNDQLVKIKNKKSILWKILDIIFILLTGIFIGFLIGIYI
jgi:hypothetical protein